jgi:hypothetical protein
VNPTLLRSFLAQILKVYAGPVKSEQAAQCVTIAKVQNSFGCFAVIGDERFSSSIRMDSVETKASGVGNRAVTIAVLAIHLVMIDIPAVLLSTYKREPWI